MTASTRKKKPSVKKGSVVRELGAIHEWMKDHEKHDDKRFEEGKAKMATLATKDDIQTVMVDQASKEDFSKLARMLFDEKGQPMFATKQDMEPVLNLYKGSTFVRSAVAGLAGTVITLAALGYALIQLVSWLRGH
jgi:hypothetical protein